MRQALALAQKAADAGEVPVGAVLVRNGQVIATGHNAPIGERDPTAHAEIQALRAAARAMGNYRLDDCELYVTLEPCAMCSGAMLHARLKRVIFGAADAKTGAAGSVVNLFANTSLNHHTKLESGVMGDECAAALQSFFQRRRAEIAQDKRQQIPLRQDALRTPDACFAALPDYPWQGRYMVDLPSLAGLCLHYLDEGPCDAPKTYVLLHANASWSYQYRQLIQALLPSGYRVLAPDCIGFGRSDKPKKAKVHTLEMHCNVLREWTQSLDLWHVVLVGHGWGNLLGEMLYALMPERIDTVQAWQNPQELTLGSAGYAAPFPDKGHRVGIEAVAGLMQHFNEQTQVK